MARIAFFSANVRSGQDGVTRVLHRIIQSAIEREHEVMVFTSDKCGESPWNVPICRVPSVRVPVNRDYRLAVPSSKYFALQLQSFDPDIVHLHTPCTLGFAALKYARRTALPVVATYHTHFPSYLEYYKLKPLEALAWKLICDFYGRCDRTFVPTNTIMRELSAHGIGQLQLLSNGVDLRGFSPAYRSEGWRANVGANGKSVLLFVSRLVWEKNLVVLDEAYRRLSARRNDFVMVIVGDGHARAKLEQMMPGACFLGYKGGDDLANCYASSDVFVFPSVTETFGNVTIEAMASGAVPVAASVGGAVDIIEEGLSGFLAAPGSPVDLADKVELLLDSPNLRAQMSQRALRRARLFAWDSILDQLFESYDQTISEHEIHLKETNEFARVVPSRARQFFFPHSRQANEGIQPLV